MIFEPFVYPIQILLIEDNPGDIRLTQEILKDSKFHNELMVARNGEEALDYLYRRGGHRDAAHPDLILLDLNLPKKGGHEVLAQVKADPELKRIPVVVLTSSAAEEDILKTYNLHVNCYISKPVNLEQFYTVVQLIENFWLSIVKLPTRATKNEQSTI
jgi:two-component system, chemotaxis family, response regulator Rcp1